MEIRKIEKEEMEKALDLVWRTFLEYEAPDYAEEGIQEFKKSIDDEIWLNERDFFGAFEDNEIRGVIATKDKSHIALFFVDGRFHKQGIGKKLYQKICSTNDKGYFTVNSSPYAKEVYHRLGFRSVDNEQCINGLRFIPMEAEISLEIKPDFKSR